MTSRLYTYQHVVETLPLAEVFTWDRSVWLTSFCTWWCLWVRALKTSRAHPPTLDTLTASFITRQGARDWSSVPSVHVRSTSSYVKGLSWNKDTTDHSSPHGWVSSGVFLFRFRYGLAEKSYLSRWTSHHGDCLGNHVAEPCPVLVYLGNHASALSN